MRTSVTLFILGLAFCAHPMTWGQEKDEAKKPIAVKAPAIRLVRPAIMAQPAVQVMPGMPAMAPVAQDDLPSNPIERDAKILSNMGVGSKAEQILEFIRKRTVPEANPKTVAEWCDALGDEEFVVREKAFANLSALGAGALPGLKQVENSNNAEVRRRAMVLKQRLESNAEPQAMAAAARTLARLKPPQALEVILNYLPNATDTQVVDELCQALAANATRDGQVDPVLVKSLQDKTPIRRAAAGEALARANAKAQMTDVKALLKDSDPTVRLRVSLSLLTHRDRDVIPVFIELMNELPAEQLWSAEEVLFRLADESAPSVALGTTPDSRKTCRDAWHAWYVQNGAKLDYKKLGEPIKMLGTTLICQQSFNRVRVLGNAGGRVGVGGEVMEVDQNKAIKFRFDVEGIPVDAAYTSDGKIVVAEYQNNRVSCRNTKGEILWQKADLGGNPIGVQPLSNGGVVVILQNKILQLDDKGVETASYTRNQFDIMRGRKHRNGDIALVTNSGQYVRIDEKTRKEVKTFHVGHAGILFGGMDVLPNGGVLLPDYNQSRIVEFDANGRQTKSFNLQWPNSAQRLPNGHTLASSQNTRRVVEFDREGREVWSFQSQDGQIYNARKY